MDCLHRFMLQSKKRKWVYQLLRTGKGKVRCPTAYEARANFERGTNSHDQSHEITSHYIALLSRPERFYRPSQEEHNQNIAVLLAVLVQLLLPEDLDLDLDLDSAVV